MTIKQHTFDSWRDFKLDMPEIFGGATPIMKRFVFRGQADADWPLESSFDRAFVGDNNERAAAYLRYLHFFRALNRRLGKTIPQNNDEAGALAQHYGMPTRLLDWSLSPYAATFFAFYYAKVQKIESTHVAIWAAETALVTTLCDPRHFQILKSRSAENARINRQVGCFIVARGEISNLGEYLESRSTNISPLHRCLIPTRYMDEALNDLILMGQTPVDIYPDFEGVAKYVRLRMAFDGFNL